MHFLSTCSSKNKLDPSFRTSSCQISFHWSSQPSRRGPSFYVCTFLRASYNMSHSSSDAPGFTLRELLIWLKLEFFYLVSSCFTLQLSLHSFYFLWITWSPNLAVCTHFELGYGIFCSLLHFWRLCEYEIELSIIAKGNTSQQIGLCPLGSRLIEQGSFLELSEN